MPVPAQLINNTQAAYVETEPGVFKALSKVENPIAKAVIERLAAERR